jgi:hypothetical protein
VQDFLGCSLVMNVAQRLNACPPLKQHILTTTPAVLEVAATVSDVIAPVRSYRALREVRCNAAV